MRKFSIYIRWTFGYAKDMSRISFILLFDDTAYGVRILSAILKRHGHETFIVSVKDQEDFLSPPAEPLVSPEYGTSLGCSENEMNLVVQVLKEQNPDWVGISIISNYTDLAICISERIREELSVPIVWGGIDATFNPDIAIQTADIVCLGEAEDTVVELAEALEGKGSLADIEGIWYRDNGAVRKNPDRQPPEDLDSLPFPDYDLSHYTLIHQEKIVRGRFHPQSLLGLGRWTLMATRGCPYRCSFCCNGVEDEEVPFNHGLRSRSPENVVAEMRWVRQNQPHVQSLFFTDEIFGPDLRWLESFAKTLDNKRMFPLHLYVHPNFVKPRRMELYRDVGTDSVAMGIQSGSERVNRTVYNRHTSEERIIEAMGLLIDMGFVLLVELIGSNPLETEEDFRASAEFIVRLPRPYNIGTIYPLTFWRNYALTNMAFRQGIPLRQLGVCTWRAEESDEFRFRDAFLLFVALSGMPVEAIRPLLDDQTLRRQPEILKHLNETLKHYYFYRERSSSYMPKDTYIKQLKGEVEYLGRQLDTLRGSRFVKYYFRGKDRVLRLAGR